MAGSLPDGNVFMQQAGLGNMARTEQIGSTNLPLSVGGTPNGQQRLGNLRNTIDRLLGGGIQLNETRAVDLDKTYASAPQAAMGLTVGVSGRATVVNSEVASHLAEYQDPIKSLLGVSLHRDHRIIIKRRYVQGSDAQVIPERAPGRTVSVKTEEREVVLARYGGDIEMSTNLMAGEPALAQQDLSLKLNFQKAQLDRKLTELGYAAIMETASDSARALLESLPNRAGMSQAQAAVELEIIRARVYFAAFERFEQPLNNLLASAKRGALMNADPYDTIIIPAGLPDMHKFSKQENRHFFLNGTPDSEMTGVQFDLGGGLHDTPTGLSCYVHYPKANYAQGGTLRPRATESPMYRKRTIAMWYKRPAGANQAQIMNFESGEWMDLPAGVDGCIRYLTLMMSSAIIGKGGSDTGELIVAYPITSVHTVETSPEYMKMQLRCHLGAAIYRPENVQVLADIHCEGFVAQHLTDNVAMNSTDPIKVFGGAGVRNRGAPGCEGIPGHPAGGIPGLTADLPGIAFRGAMRHKAAGDASWTYVSNGGHLGELDCPEGMSRIRGHNVFSRTETPVKMRSC